MSNKKIHRYKNFPHPMKTRATHETKHTLANQSPRKPSQKIFAPKQTNEEIFSEGSPAAALDKDFAVM
jgi:hypothetical protein